MFNEEENKIEVLEYNTHKRPLIFIIFLFLFFLISLLILDIYTKFWISTAFAKSKISAILFILYSFLYASIWLVYFTSSIVDCFKVQTLRHLLRLNSYQWNMTSEGDKMEIDYYEKARSTITSQAIFIAITVFIINAITRKSQFFEDPSNVLFFPEFFAHFSLVAAVIAFVLLLISTDAVETTFHKFIAHDIEITSYFHNFAANIKYYGFIFSFLAIIFYVATISSYIASSGIALFLLVGYRYWFPCLSLNKKFSREFIIFSILVFLMPVVVSGYFYLVVA